MIFIRVDGDITPCYAKILYPKEEPRTTLYLIKQYYGGAGPIHNGIPLWVHESVRQLSNEQLLRNYVWVSQHFAEEVDFLNENLTCLLHPHST